ncbi:MAG TPA: 16S rRNA (cytidine(1402)-2'-O)-methyltransferase [Acidimicrobiales bacterium]|nr:16S rRNA (cytidine(1402)-2'-O)-methyltransferase [Acidimicrobiales bacterium]
MTGKVVLVATPIGNLGDLSPRAVEVLAAADVIACEDTRHTRKLLTAAGISPHRLVALHEHNEREQAERLVARAAAGESIAVVSDAGTPAISDPGERLVDVAVREGVVVEVVPGPSAAIAALVVSGLPAARFCFEGFLPRKGRDRADRLAAVAAEERTTVLFESPHRVGDTLADLVEVCGPTRRVALARELTKLYEEVWRGPLAEAVDWVDGRAVRGEFVIVVGGAERVAAGEADVDDALALRLAAGVDTKTAVAEVAAELRVPKRQVYAAALRLTR